MTDLILGYFFLGTLWLILHEIVEYKMDVPMKIRLVLFWPITLIALIIGIIHNFIDKDKFE